MYAAELAARTGGGAECAVMIRWPLLSALVLAAALPAARAVAPLPGTQPLEETGDLAARMVQGMHRFLDRENAVVVKARDALWKPDSTSPGAWEKSMEPRRARLRELLGLTDVRRPANVRPAAVPNEAGDIGGVEPVRRIEWDVVRDIKAEGLVSQLDERSSGIRIIVLPDIGTTPEQMFGLEPGVPPERQWANRFSQLTAYQVFCPALVDRRTGAVMPEGRASTLTQREVLWRAGFEMGRSLTAYDLQTVLALVDWLNRTPEDEKLPVAVVGTGESGRLALMAAAIDPRIDAVMVEGCLGPMENQWDEPIDRTVFALLREFGTAELVSMIAPRRVVWSESGWPKVRLTDQGGGAPGRIEAPAPSIQDAEAARPVLPPLPDKKGRPEPYLWKTRPDHSADDAVHFLSVCLGDQYETDHPFAVPCAASKVSPVDQAARQARLFNNLLEDTQVLMRQAQKTRGEYWKAADRSSAEKFTASANAWREKFWTGITGKLPPARLPANPRTRQIYDTAKFTGWEVMLDVYPDVFSFGILLLPKDLQPGEKRAVVVCQHGLEGRPTDVADPEHENPAYHRYAVRLAEKGYIVFAPQNPYIGKTEFRQICRKAWPLGLSLWSFIVRQHEVILTWLKTQPNVDASRIAFYGLSYGGKSAMRLPALLPDYCLSICSADYNEWIWKNVDASAPYCYLHTNEYDMVEWNMGNTFNYAELSWLIFPRPFMVERGHDDGVSCDEWVAYEFARTRRHYSKLGLGDRAEIEFFNGPHTINGQGTFRFLDKWLAR